MKNILLSLSMLTIVVCGNIAAQEDIYKRESRADSYHNAAWLCKSSPHRAMTLALEQTKNDQNDETVTSFEMLDTLESKRNGLTPSQIARLQGSAGCERFALCMDVSVGLFEFLIEQGKGSVPLKDLDEKTQQQVEEKFKQLAQEAQAKRIHK